MENETITNQNKYRLGLFLLNALCGLFLRENSSSLIGCLFLAHFPPFLPNKLRNARKRKKIDAFSSYWIMKYWSSCQVLAPPPQKNSELTQNGLKRQEIEEKKFATWWFPPEKKISITTENFFFEIFKNLNINVK